MGEKMDSEREAFEKWYVENAFDYEANPLGSRDCGLQWKAWQAAHLTQPAQAVDVEEIRTVAGMLDGYCEASDDRGHGTLSTSLVRDLTKRITAALPNANGKEGIYMASCGKPLCNENDHHPLCNAIKDTPMLPDEVRKAVEAIECWAFRSDEAVTDADEWQTIKAHLLAREADVERLNAAWDSSFKQAMLNGQSAQEQRARAERAEANLEAANKAVDTYREMLVSIIKVVRERDDRQLQAHIDATGITAHLENSRG